MAKSSSSGLTLRAVEITATVSPFFSAEISFFPNDICFIMD